jgi:hypothetical protein
MLPQQQPEAVDRPQPATAVIVQQLTCDMAEGLALAMRYTTTRGERALLFGALLAGCIACLS